MVGQTLHSSWKVNIRRLAAFASVGLLAICGTYLYLLSSQFPAMPPLLQHVPSTPFDPNSQEMFSQKLRDRFPIGSHEADLIRELWLEGFLPKTDLRAPKRIAEFNRFGDVIHDICRRGGEVYWSADDAGILTAVSGHFFVDC
jgi:hypothetical protein